MSIIETQAAKAAGKLFRKAIFSPKLPVKAIRENYDAILSTVTLPNNVDRQEVDAGNVKADLLIPEMAIGERTILYAHGGDFVAGSRRSARNLCASLAHESASRLLLPEYRLAPEYPFPTALEDLFGAYAWLLRQGIPPSEIYFAGDGAGANLVISLVHYLSTKQTRRPRGVIAISPWVDLECAGSSMHDRKILDPIHSPETLALEALQYTYQANFKNPHVSPINGDFQFFPDLYVQCGSAEILVDDARRLAKKAQNENTLVTLDIEQDMWHLFQANDALTPRAHLAVKKIGQWVRSRASAEGN